ncbi:autophagocytosis associated protein [Lipomyces arxii]|uniref:autophagocytosis associated protein n=1 Tax=Lipomyces arxii TaxID=56418 RepID=UPI0034CE1CB0
MLRLRSTISSLREYLAPISDVSTFKQTGEITPEEFVLAGDYLVYKFPTWSWGTGPESKRRDFLPADKQFLVTKHVACNVRAQTAVGGFEQEEEDEDEDGFTVTYSNPVQASRQGQKHTQIQPEEDVIDIDDMEANEMADPGYLSESEGAVQTSVPDRSYSLYITYSTSYRVPKMYLSGFNATGGPLSPDEMFEDIVSEYKDKTVTIETAPFLDNVTMVSIHPCRHAAVMKLMLNRAEARQRRLAAKTDEQDMVDKIDGLGLDSEEWEDLAAGATTEEGGDAAIRVDQYLVIFLKFISSVTPGIEHDNTMSAL